MIVQKIYKLRFLILLLVVGLGFFLWKPFQRALVVNNSLRIWFKEDDPSLRQYDAFQQHFGSDEVIVILFSDERGVWRKPNVAQLQQLTRALENHPAVASVLSLANVKELRKVGISVLATELLTPSLSEKQVRMKLAESSSLSQYFVNDDLTATRLLVQLKQAPDIDERRGAIIRSIKEEAYRQINSEHLAFGGVGVIFEGLNELTQRDFGFFLAMAYLVMFTVLLVLYRRPLVLALALGVILLSTYFTLGLYGLAGYELNLMTVLIPVILVLLGLLDVIHLTNERVYIESTNPDAFQKAIAALRQVWKPCLFTTLTTMAGFLSLTLSPLAILREFGLFSALGVLLCLLFTYLLGLLLLPWLRRPPPPLLDMTPWWHWLYRYRKAFLVVTLLVAVGSLVGVFRIQADTYTLGYFPDDHPVVQDHHRIAQEWGDYMPLELIMRVNDGQSVSSPEALQRSARLLDSLTQVEGIGSGFSLASLTEAGLQMRYGERASQALRSTVAVRQAQQLLRRYYPDWYHRTVDSSGTYTRITLFGRMLSAAALQQRISRLEQIGQSVLGDSAQLMAAGYLPIYAEVTGYVIRSQVQSLALAVGLIFLLVWLFIRDFRLAGVAVLTNLFPLGVLFGTMGWLGIDLDIATASIAAIGLSFCIDDSIHFIHAYRKNRMAGLTNEAAQVATFQKIGPAVITSSLVLFCGYILMVFASLKTVYLFGSLTALMVVAALYAQLVIFPWLMRGQ